MKAQRDDNMPNQEKKAAKSEGDSVIQQVFDEYYLSLGSFRSQSWVKDPMVRSLFGRWFQNIDKGVGKKEGKGK